MAMNCGFQSICRIAPVRGQFIAAISSVTKTKYFNTFCVVIFKKGYHMVYGFQSALYGYVMRLVWIEGEALLNITIEYKRFMFGWDVIELEHEIPHCRAHGIFYENKPAYYDASLSSRG